MSNVESSDLHSLIERVGKHLPSQGPLKDFIHHNPLHAFQKWEFHRGVLEAEKIFGARPYLKFDDYRQLLKKGSITQSGIQKALTQHSSSPAERAFWKKQMHSLFEEDPPRPLTERGLRALIWENRLLRLQSDLGPRLFRLLGNYMDQGIAQWSMPGAENGLWSSLGQLVEDSIFPIEGLSSPSCRRLLKCTAQEAMAFVLERILGEQHQLFERYLEEMLLSHPGWSGMVAFLEKNPQSLLEPRSVKLQDAISLELLLELSFCEKELGEGFKPLITPEKLHKLAVILDAQASNHSTSDQNVVRALWQEAYEWSYYEKVLGLLQDQKTHPIPENKTPAKTQLFFCIDDRECSLRRHLEEIDEDLKTWGVPGFFGIDWYFKSAGSNFALKMCPAPVQAKYLVEEIPNPFHEKRIKASPLPWRGVDPSSGRNSLLRGFFATQVWGLLHGFKLAWSIFLPSAKRPNDLYNKHIAPEGVLDIHRKEEANPKDGLLRGFTVEEMADRVQSVLKSVGCLSDFSPLMVFVAHGASSVNNPYFAAYDCGACSGRPGAANARAFVQMANDFKVRNVLHQRGLHLSPDIHFVGAFHDTTRDELTFFHEEFLPKSHVPQLLALKETLNKALENNAKERCRRFELVRKDISPANALRHVRQRAHSIFEPRPELNHATNCLCIVGTRELTRGSFFDRRAFLQSYDWKQDPNGDVLVTLLNAVVPVCGGINLEYYFSRTDSERYGSGTKLSHNVMGLLGVANGIEGDLLTGLPTQMTELHPPLRLLMVIEQEPEIVLTCLEKSPPLKKWICHEWIRLACLSPSTGKMFFFEKGVPMESSVQNSRSVEKTFLNSPSITNGKAGDLDPVQMTQRTLS